MLDHPDTAAICVACGTGTCSSNCHTVHMESTNLCTFHNNFKNPSESKKLNVRNYA